MFIHKDNRRTIIEWIRDYPIRSCKVIIANEDTEIGGHYHNNKEDIFYLLSGEGFYKLGNGKFKPMEIATLIPKKKRHTFQLKKGAVVLEASTMPFDINDELT